MQRRSSAISADPDEFVFDQYVAASLRCSPLPNASGDLRHQARRCKSAGLFHVSLLFALNDATAIATVPSAEVERRLARFGNVSLAICIAAPFGLPFGECLRVFG